MTTRRRLPRAAASAFGSTILHEGEIAYDQTLRRFRMGDGATPGGKLLATMQDAAASVRAPPGLYGSVTGGTNPANTYLMAIDAAILIRPSDGLQFVGSGLNISVDMKKPGPVKNGRDTNTRLGPYEQGYIYLIANGQTDEKALIASQAESFINVKRPAGFDFICPYAICWYVSDVGSNLRNMSIYGRRHTYVKHADGNGMPFVASGAAGNPKTPATFVAKSLAQWVPRLAHSVTLAVSIFSGTTKVCPDPDYDGSDGSGGIGLTYGGSVRNTLVNTQIELNLEDYYDRQIFYASDDPLAVVGVYSFALSFGNLGG